ncbi:MAG TPA: 3'-5' exonuclease, partial [Tepidisphaeraceae bacterium]|nr:3'-5' exonuclease [Tepidisphaeraceae bacterium]
IKDVLAYLRVIANPADEVSLERIVNVPTRGIGDSSVKQMQAWAIGQGISLFEAMRRAAEINGLSTRAVNSVTQFIKLVESWRQLAAAPPGGASSVRAIMEDIVKRSGMETNLKKIGGDEQEEISNVNELITSAAEYDSQNTEGSLQDYLAQVSLVSDVDHLKDSGGAVTLMTLHAAKGLEFPVVAMMGLEEGCLPHSRARDNVNELEEERRLCFVGITRAQQRLILTKAAYRTLRGLRERTVTSPFLSEMPQESFDLIDHTGISRYERSSDFHEPQSNTSFKRGQLVRHPTFGMGRIEEITDIGQQTRAVVQFNSAGRKTLILQYAKLEAVG